MLLKKRADITIFTISSHLKENLQAIQTVVSADSMQKLTSILLKIDTHQVYRKLWRGLKPRTI